MKKSIATLSLIAIFCSGCVASHSASMGEHAEWSGSPEALRAMGDVMVGMMKTAKEKDSAPNQYLAERMSNEKEITARAAQPGFFPTLFGTDKKGS